MLASLIIAVYTTLLLSVYGVGFLALAARLFSVPLDRPPLFLHAALAGLVPLVWLTSLWSIFLPVNQITSYVLLAGGLLLVSWIILKHRDWTAAWRNSFRHLHPLVWVTGGLALLTALVLSTLKPGNSDTGLYHAQAIHWIELFPVVPGLGNYHSRLAYNSNWFPLQAGFSFAFLKLRSFHLMGAVLTGLSLAYFTGGLQGLSHGSRRLSDWTRLIFLPLTYYILASEISSPGTDLPVTLLTWIILCLWLEERENPVDGGDCRTLLLICLPVLLVSIKLSAFPLLLVTAWILFLRLRATGGWRWLAAAAGLSLLFLSPWLVRNVIVSGYIAYPQTAVDLFNVPWKIPLNNVRDEADWITSWARFPFWDKDIILAMPIWQWAPMWFDDLTKNRQALLLVVAAAPLGFGLAALVSRVFFRRRMKDWFQPFTLTWPLWVVTYAGLAFWIFSVPGIRFGIGLLTSALVLSALCGTGLFRGLLTRFSRIGVYAAALLVCLYVSSVLAASADVKTLGSRLLLPANYVNLPTEPCEFGNFSTACATQYLQCGYSPFPCAPQGHPDVYMRGSSLRDGFEVR